MSLRATCRLSGSPGGHHHRTGPHGLLPGVRIRASRELRLRPRMKCQHENFESQVNVFRLYAESDPDKITAYTAEIEIRCKDCESPMLFISVPKGSHPTHPMASFDLRQLRAPIEPAL